MDIAHELALAHAARAQGNAGRARVCARRAAGQALRDFYHQPGDALRQLQRLQADARCPRPLRQAAERLLTKVTPQHEMPFANDVVEDAQAIITFCVQSPADSG